MGQFQKDVQENYVPEPYVDNRTGKRKWRYRYRGALYRWAADEAQLRRLKRSTVLFLCLDALAFAIAALSRGDINRDNWIVIPGMLSVIGLAYMLWGTVEFCRTGDQFRADVLRACQLYLVGGGIFHGAAVLFAGCFTLLHLLQGRLGTGSWRAAVCYLLSAAACSRILWIHGRLKEGLIRSKET